MMSRPGLEGGVVAADLVERARREGTPLIDGESATFVWQGEHAPHLIGDFSGWGARPGLELHAAGPGVWERTLTLPRDAYIEYAYMRDGQHAPDPFNPRSVSNGIGAYNQFFYMSDAAPTPWMRRATDRPHGRLSRHVLHDELTVVGGARTVYLYHPLDAGPYPLLVVLDGLDYLRRARLARLVDNLIAAARIPPLALALVANGGQARFVEYACNDSTVAFLLSHVVLLARAHLNLADLEAHPGAYGVLGASMGGLAALYTVLRAPTVFGHAVSQSGAFALGALGREPVVVDLVRHVPPPRVKVWLDVGTYEQLLPANQRMYVLLHDRGYDVTYHEYHGGHNYTAWRDDVWRGLEALYGQR
jgi:enterochelin esterase family protein